MSIYGCKTSRQSHFVVQLIILINKITLSRRFARKNFLLCFTVCLPGMDPEMLEGEGRQNPTEPAILENVPKIFEKRLLGPSLNPHRLHLI